MLIALRILAKLFTLTVLLFFLWLILAKPRRPRAAAALFSRTVYAHRGLHNKAAGIPENSMKAFAAAVEAGFGIELDVQISKDGIPVVFHDGELKRVCGISGVIADFTADELSRLPLSGVGETGIPRLSEVLEVVGGRVPLVIEIKGERVAEAVRCIGVTMPLLDAYAGAFCVESFNPLVLQWLSKNRPGVVRGQLAGAFIRNPKRRAPRYFALSLFLFNFITRPDFIAYDFRDRSFLPFRILRRCFDFYAFAWTPRSREDCRLCAKFDTVIFENEPPEAYTGKNEVTT